MPTACGAEAATQSPLAAKRPCPSGFYAAAYTLVHEGEAGRDTPIIPMAPAHRPVSRLPVRPLRTFAKACFSSSDALNATT